MIILTKAVLNILLLRLSIESTSETERADYLPSRTANVICAALKFGIRCVSIWIAFYDILEVISMDTKNYVYESLKFQKKINRKLGIIAISMIVGLYFNYKNMKGA